MHLGTCCVIFSRLGRYTNDEAVRSASRRPQRRPWTGERPPRRRAVLVSRAGGGRLLAAALAMVDEGEEAVSRDARARCLHRGRCFNDNRTYCKVAALPSRALQ